MDARKRAEKFHGVKQGFILALTALSCFMSFTSSPLDPEVTDVEWRAIGIVMTIMFSFLYVLNHILGPDYGDEE